MAQACLRENPWLGFSFGRGTEDNQHITQMEVEKQHALLCLIFQHMPWEQRDVIISPRLHKGSLEDSFRAEHVNPWLNPWL